MSAQSEANLKGIPTKPYDLLREGLIVFAFVAVLTIVLAAIFSSPDYPAVTIKEVAQKQPIAYLQMVTDYFSGNSDLQTYGPPYTKNPENAQTFLGIAPANIFGVTIPIDAQKDFVITPLEGIAKMDPGVKTALDQFQAAGDKQQQAWIKNYSDALDKAAKDEESGAHQSTTTKAETGKDTASTLNLPTGDYGPVSVLMQSMLTFARAGFMAGALNTTSTSPYAFDNTKALLFMAGDVESDVADKLDMQGGEWGIGHETGNYPGAWWLWPYTFLYQIPAIGNSPNADALVGGIMGILFLVLIFLPLIPVLNRIPKWLKVYRVIWRDWYKEHGKT